MMDRLFRKNPQRFCLLVLVIYFIFGLWPFNFLPRNGVQSLPEEPGVRFNGKGMAYAERPIFQGADLQASDSAASFTVELWLQASAEPTDGVPAIFTIYDGRLPENMLIGQWRSEVLLRLPFADPKAILQYREVGASEALPKGKASFLTITGDRAGTVFFQNGKLKKRYPGFRTPAANLNGAFTLCAAAGMHRAWKGTMYGLALYSRSLAEEEVGDHYRSWMAKKMDRLRSEEGLEALFLFEGVALPGKVMDLSSRHHDLVVPEIYHVVDKIVLSSLVEDFRFSWSYFQDMLVNTLGFVPLGFFFFLCFGGRYPYLQRKTLLAMTLSLGVAVSLSIELLQYFLPTRSSQMMDLLLNSIGGWTGIRVAQSLWRKDMEPVKTRDRSGSTGVRL